MNNPVFKLAGAVIACAVISACSNSDVSNPAIPPLNSGTPSAGTANFTTFVSIGDSLTAGYADGALYRLGQTNSFPNILAQQFANANGVAVSFTQPLVNDNIGGLVAGGGPILDSNGVNCCEPRFVLNTATEKPERLTDTPTTDITNPVTGPFNNMGVPGAKAIHLGVAGYGAGNPYFARFASSAGASMIGDATLQQPSFYVLWIGNNDVLGYATSGGDGSDTITPPATFKGVYNQLVLDFKNANSAVQGVLVNIPDVSTIPYFTTIPYNPVPLDQASADLLNAAYAPYNAGIQQAFDAGAIPAAELAQRTIAFTAGQNAVVIVDETLSPVGAPLYRQATASDLIVLPTGAKLGTESVSGDPTTIWGLGTPLVDADVLIPSEISAIDTARQAFNTTIKTAADNDPNLAFFDAAAIMTQLSTTGINFGSGSINADFATGGAFSLDGVHPTARGYAVIANSIIEAINSNFSANVYKVDPALYPTIFLK